MKKICISTLGCKLNYFESQAIAEKLSKRGYIIVDSPDESDLTIVNTCTVTNKADVKSRQAMKRAKRQGNTVIATGCLATTDTNLLSEYDFVDRVVTNVDKFSIDEIVTLIEQEKTDYLSDAISGCDDFPEVESFERTRGFVKIQEGCNKFCSYCKIPFARGRSHSLAPDKVLEMVSHLVARGFKELVLTGVNISDYHYEKLRLSHLVGKILELPGDFRIRLSSLQPDEFEDELIGFLPHPRFANHFHLSVQNGSDSVLKRMNRHYTHDYFLELCEKIRGADPLCGITTDIIVGFPGETDKEFEDTKNLVRQAQFTRAHIFTYSPRNGTRAAQMKDINGNIKRNREKTLKQIAIDSSLRFANENLIGKNFRVLTESQSENGWEGYTDNYFRIICGQTGLTENQFVHTKAEKAIVINDVVELR